MEVQVRKNDRSCILPTYKSFLTALGKIIHQTVGIQDQFPPALLEAEPLNAFL